LGILGPLPRFFVSVAFKGFSFGVSCLDATVAGGCVDVDSKGDADGRLWVRDGSVGEAAQVDFSAECAEFAEKEGMPHPGCFL